jgi:hypothetical protein
MSIRTICCVCHKTKNLDGWLDQFIHQYKSLSHGYCPECFEKTMKQLQRKNRENQAGPGQQAGKDLHI